jgi:hypothetical protein
MAKIELENAEEGLAKLKRMFTAPSTTLSPADVAGSKLSV